jgi:hypothetical protein
MEKPLEVSIPFDLIISEDIKQSLEDFMCSICQNLLVSPVCCKLCDTLYCAECLNSWIMSNPSNKCPHCRTQHNYEMASRIIMNLLNKIKLKCLNFTLGCEEIVLYEGYPNHLNSCKYRDKFQRKVKEGFINPQLDVKCRICSLTVNSYYFHLHNKSCILQLNEANVNIIGRSEVPLNPPNNLNKTTKKIVLKENEIKKLNRSDDSSLVNYSSLECNQDHVPDPISQCPICGEISQIFLDVDMLDMHYYKDCPLVRISIISVDPMRKVQADRATCRSLRTHYKRMHNEKIIQNLPPLQRTNRKRAIQRTCEGQKVQTFQIAECRSKVLTMSLRC